MHLENGVGRWLEIRHRVSLISRCQFVDTELDRVTDDIRRESMSLVGIHWPILTTSAALLGNTVKTVT